MIKRVTSVNEAVSPTEWLDLIPLADVDVTSEHPARAAAPGVQTIRLRFRRPVRLTGIRLVFKEAAVTRTQEFVLRWQAAGARASVDIVRQQFTFAPPGTTTEREDYRVDLDEVSALELSITPQIGGGDAIATLQQFWIAA